MKLFLDGIPLGDVPGPGDRPGEFFPRLVGVRVSSGGNLEALYIPVLRVQRRAGQVWIEINWDRPLAYITLQRRPPYLRVFRFPWRLWEQEDWKNA